MPLSYADTLTHWDRSKAFGDPRDFRSFATDMETLHPGLGFGDAASRDGWWTRASARIDQNVFEPVASVTTEPLGEAVGGFFGAEEAGARVGRNLPRALIETAPLYLAGPEAGVPATLAAAGATGGLMAAHTYAETGSAKAAAISGVTGTVLPAVGRFGANVLPRALGLGESVSPRVLEETIPLDVGSTTVSRFFPGGVLPKEGVSQAGFKAAQFGGSQLAQIGLNEASMAATDKTLGQPFDPLSPDFWLQQIPFTVFDATHIPTGKISTSKEIRGMTQKVEAPKTEYVPPKVSNPEAEAQVGQIFKNLGLATDPAATPEQRDAAFALANAVAMDPKGTTQRGKVVKASVEPTSEVTGHGKELFNGNWKVLTTDVDGNEKTLFVNGVKPTKNADGTVTFAVKPSQMQDSVTSPLKKSDFGILDPNQPPLPTQEKPWVGFHPDEQRTLQQHGVDEPPPETPEDVRQMLREHAQELEATGERLATTRERVATVPESAEEVPNIVGDPELAKPKIQSALESGSTPTQAVEKARLSTQTPQVDEALQQLEVLRKQARELTQAARSGPETVKPVGPGGREVLSRGESLLNEKGERHYFGSSSEALEFLENHKIEHPEDTTEWEPTSKGSVKKGTVKWYLGTKIGKQSVEGQGESEKDYALGDYSNILERDDVEEVAPKVVSNDTEASASTPLESRPDVSFDDVLTQLDRATKVPKVFAGESGLDLPDAILALRQAKVVLPEMREGRSKFTEVNAALAKAKVPGFVNEAHMRETMRAVKAGVQGMTGYRKFDLESHRPFDQATVDELGIQHEDQPTAVRNVIEWYINHPDSGVMGEVAAAMLKARGTEGLKLSFDSHDGTVFYEGDRRINMSWLPTKAEAFDFAQDFVHEYAHDVGMGVFDRSDPAAVNFRATLTEALATMKTSREIPKEVRKAISEVGEWYTKYLADNDPFGFYQEWEKTVGKGQDDWLHVIYSFANERELLSTMFNSPKLVELMTRTKMERVGQRPTVMEYLSKAWSRLFGGEKRHDSVLANILGGFDNYLSGSKVPPREIRLGPTHDAGAGFFYGLADYDPVKNVLGGKHKLPNSGVVTEQQLKSIGGIGKPLANDEILLYRSLVPEAFDGEKVNVGKLVQGLKEKGPVVEVRKLGGALDTSNRLEQIIHEVETRGYNLGVDGDNQIRGLTNRQTGDQASIDGPVWDQVPQDLREMVEEAQRIRANEVSGRNEDASRYSFLSPRPESEMEGYVEGLVRVPTDVSGKPKSALDIESRVEQKNRNIKYTGPHFGSEDTNVLSFFRGFEDKGENVTFIEPNSKYKTLLSPEDVVFHDIENQSDWAKKVREEQEQLRKRDATGVVSEEAKRQLKEVGTPTHPLLSVSNELSLKAAIQHAVKVGAKWFFQPDAETVMMTEGHDRATTRNAVAGSGEEPRIGDWGIRYPDGRITVYLGTEESARQHVGRLKTGDYKIDQVRPEDLQVAKPTQFDGMDLHYNKLLPSVMEKLTGGKGERVEVGIHKGAEFIQRPDIPYQRGSPVFKNEQGNPKTQITGRVYDISKVPTQQTLFENKAPSVAVRQSYNGRDYIRDVLIGKVGVRPEALASRVDTIERVFSTGSLQPSIEGFSREMEAKTLPATASTETLNPELSTLLSSGEPTAVRKAGLSLLADEVPVHHELLQRMKEDIETAVSLYTNIKKGLIPGTLPPNARENLQLAHVRVDALGHALDKQARDISRWKDLNNFTQDGIEDTQIGTLVGKKLPAPPDPTEMQDIAQGVMGLGEVRRESAEAELKGEGKLGALTRWLGMTQFVKKTIPQAAPAINHVREANADYTERDHVLNLSYAYEPGTSNFSEKVAKNNMRVQTTESLTKVSSDLYRWINEQEQTKKEWSFQDDFAKKLLKGLNQSDRDAVQLEINSHRQRQLVWINQMVEPTLKRVNIANTASVIAAREVGMLPDRARELAGQLHGALMTATDPQTAPHSVEVLRGVAEGMQPSTFLAAMQHAKGGIEDLQQHVEFLNSRLTHVSEQRYDAHHLVMRGPDGQAFRYSGTTREAVLRVKEQKEAAGYTFLDYIPKSDVNAPVGIRADTLNQMEELDVQHFNRMEQALKGVDPAVAELVLSSTQRAAQYRSAKEAFKPLPNVTRRFVEGREYLNMLQNSHEFYRRGNNWLRVMQMRAEANLDMMHPEVAGWRSLREYLQQHVENNITPDNPHMRRLAEATYFQRLAFNLGNSMLESVQNLGTGMQSVISETGSVTDAFGLWGSALKELTGFARTKKWSNSDTEWMMNRAEMLGIRRMMMFSDIYDPASQSAFEINRTLNNKPLAGWEWLVGQSRKFSTMFQRFNDNIGMLSGFQLARERGMSLDDAFNFAWDVKERGTFTGGKAQRAVGLFSIKTRAVPQMLQALNTYNLGWFNQMATDFSVGWKDVPRGLNATQVTGSRKAFLYGLTAQAALAGALGMPGMGQGIALIKQATGVDVKTWLRQNLAKMFDEDLSSGGFGTTLALRGALASMTPIDPSNRAAISVPFVGVDPYKGFDLAQLAGATGATVSDVVKGTLALMQGDTMGFQRMLPSVMKGPTTLFHGEGDVRDQRGGLMYQLSPQERFLTALGLSSSKLQAKRDVAESVKELNQKAEAKRQSFADSVAQLLRKGDVDTAHQKLREFQQENPTVDLKGLVKSISERVRAQVQPYDYRRDLNVGADLAGFGSQGPLGAVEGDTIRRNAEEQLGLFSKPNYHNQMSAEMLDQITASNPYLSRAAALASLRSLRPRRPSNVSWLQENQ